MTSFLDLRATSVGGVAAPAPTPREGWTAITPAALDGHAHGRDLLLVAHGFNVNRADGINELSWWEQRLRLPPTALFIGILWPGDSAWVPVVDYPFEGGEAVTCGRLLSSYLNRHLAGAKSLAFASHSLGARVVLETIGGLTRNVRTLTLMAGAIEDDCLINEYRASAAKVGAISLLASNGDTVLEYAFPIGNLPGALIASGHPYWRAALGRGGPAAPSPANARAPWQIPDGWEYRHADYLGDAAPIGPLIPHPQDVPPQGSRAPTVPTDWRPAWSAAVAASRF
jgi:hypothetical protein